MTTNQTTDKLFDKETRFIGKKLIGLNINWFELPFVLKIQTAPISSKDADAGFEKIKAALYSKLEKNFEKTIADKIFNQLLQKVQINNSNRLATPLNRLIVDITTLRQYFAEELGDWGGGGRKLKNENTNPLSTTMRRR